MSATKKAWDRVSAAMDKRRWFAKVAVAYVSELENRISELERNQNQAPNAGEDVCPHCGATDHKVESAMGVKFFVCDKWGGEIGVKA